MCNSIENAHLMMVCDKCETKVCHNFCLDPPIDFIPENEFYCHSCISRYGLENNFKKPDYVPGFLEPLFIKDVEMVQME
jgi:hypothetical protein